MLHCECKSFCLCATAAVDKELGNKEGWGKFNYKSPGRGTATHVYASFDPSLKGISDCPLTVRIRC